MNASKASPRVSVTITTYNRLHYLPQAVESVLNQTYRDFELIVVENGSTDGTKEWLRANPHPYMQVIDLPENIGAVEGMNTAIRAATGEYLTWLGSDDYFANYHLEAFVAALDSAHNIDYAYGPYYQIDSKGNIDAIMLTTALILREVVTRSGHHRNNASFMYRRSLHDEVGMFDEMFERNLWAKILERCNYIYLMEPTVYYRAHEGSYTSANENILKEVGLKTFQAFLDRHDGGISELLLSHLYPALNISPSLVPYALSDFASRMFMLGARMEALSYLKIGLSTYGMDDLLRPLLNFIALLMILQIDPIPHIQEALENNKKLTAEMKSAMTAVSQSMVTFNRLTSRLDLFTIEHDRIPLKYDVPPSFSFLSWKNGVKNPPSLTR